MSNSMHTINNLRLHKSTESLYALKWDYESTSDDMVEFEIECKEQSESEIRWRFYGRTAILCYPIFTHRLNYGWIYNFRVFITRNSSATLSEKFVCNTALEALEISGQEFTSRTLEETIIRNVSVRSFQDTNTTTTEEKDNQHSLKSFDSAFDAFDYKLWMPFKSTINQYYNSDKDYAEWVVEKKLVEKCSKNYDGFKSIKVELLMALTHSKFDANQFNLMVNTMQLIFLIDDSLDSNTKLGHSVEHTRSLITGFYTAMLGIVEPTPEKSAFYIAIKDALIYITKEFQKVADKHEYPMEVLFEHLFDTHNANVLESNWRKGFPLSADNFVENSIPEMNHYFSNRVYTAGAYIVFNWNELFLNYRIPSQVKRHPQFVRARAAAGLEVSVTNDILGAARDERHSEVNSNLVLILAKYGKMTRMRAIEKCCQIHDSLIRQYLEAKRQLLESFKEHCFIGDLNNFMERIDEFMAGHMEWMRNTERYLRATTSHYE